MSLLPSLPPALPPLPYILAILSTPCLHPDLTVNTPAQTTHPHQTPVVDVGCRWGTPTPPFREIRKALGPDAKIMLDRTGDGCGVDWTHEQALEASIC